MRSIQIVKKKDGKIYTYNRCSIAIIKDVFEIIKQHKGSVNKFLQEYILPMNDKEEAEVIRNYLNRDYNLKRNKYVKTKIKKEIFDKIERLITRLRLGVTPSRLINIFLVEYIKKNINKKNS